MTRDLPSPNLELANLDAERLVSAVAHDLKAPLVTIQGFLSRLEASARSAAWDQFQADIRRIHKTCDRMRRILDDLRELARQTEPLRQPVAVDLAEVLAEARALVAGQCPPQLQFDIPPVLPTVTGDVLRLTRAFQNVLENAYRAMAQQAQPHISVTWEATPQGHTLTLTDNGVGLDPQDIPRVFEPFRQLGASTGESGLGLSIAQRIFQAHGGTLTLSSPGVGRGATVQMTLPLTSRAD